MISATKVLKVGNLSGKFPAAIASQSVLLNCEGRRVWEVLKLLHKLCSRSEERERERKRIHQ